MSCKMQTIYTYFLIEILELNSIYTAFSYNYNWCINLTTIMIKFYYLH